MIYKYVLCSNSWTGSKGIHISTGIKRHVCVLLCICGTHYLIYLFAHVTLNDISYTVRSIRAVKFSDCMNSIVYSIFNTEMCTHFSLFFTFFVVVGCLLVTHWHDDKES